MFSDLMGSPGFDPKKEMGGLPITVQHAEAGDGPLAFEGASDDSFAVHPPTNNRMIGFSDPTRAEELDQNVESVLIFCEEETSRRILIQPMGHPERRALTLDLKETFDAVGAVGEEAGRLIHNADSFPFPEQGKTVWDRRQSGGGGGGKKDGDRISLAERMTGHPDRTLIYEDPPFVKKAAGRPQGQVQTVGQKPGKIWRVRLGGQNPCPGR